MKMQLLIVLAAVAAAYGAAVENCHMNRLDACGDPLGQFRKDTGHSFPITEEQSQLFCDDMKKSYECAEEYQNKCMTPLQLETMGFLAEGSLTTYEEFCKEGSQMREDYLKHAQCLDDASKTEEAKESYSYVEAALEELADKPPSKRLPTACCGHQLLHSKGQEMGRERCGDEAVKSYNNIVQMAVSSLPSVFCTGFDPYSAQCEAVLPPAGTKPKGTLKNSHIGQTFASIYFPDVQ